MKNQKYKVTGMTCASCVNSITKGVGNLEGVRDVNVNLAIETIDIVYDENKVDIKKIKETVNKLGYGLEDEKQNEVIIPIKGMTCASCVSTIEKALKKQ